MIKVVYIKSAKAIVKIKIEEDYYFKIINDDFLLAYIPSVSIIESEIINADAEIKFIKKQKNKIILKYPNAFFIFEEFNSKDIICFIEYLLERARQEKGIICVHGAGAIVNNKAIICWGQATGMGKTTLALDIANKNNTFYSDEKVLVDLIQKKVVGRIKNQYLSNRYWKEKFGDKQYYEHQNTSKETEYKIELFIQPIICEQTKTIYDVWLPDKFMWHLYEVSSRKIRGTSRSFFNRSYPVQSLDTQKLSTQRLEFINNFTKDVKAIYFKGSSNSAVNIILNNL